jgi:predicted acylesterase/phospholipase RssA
MTVVTQRTRLCYAALCALAMAAVLSACATRPLENEDIRTVAPLGSVALFDDNQQPISNTKKIPRKKNAHVLALSGGGSYGAFGAGVLKGWTESGKRPEFDVVTGISTGALIATLAFLGSEYDDELEDLYTNTTDEDIFSSKGVTGLFGASLLDYTPLKRQIEKMITEELLDEVGAEYLEGRRLYVGTTNLDAGKLVVWDMGAIAASGHEHRVRIFQKILRASAAVPGVFKPVYIQPTVESEARQMHVDGAVKAPILIRSFMFEMPARRRWLHVIINHKISLDEAPEAVEPKVLDIARKSISELLRGLTYKTLYQGYVTARNSNTRFRLIAIPDDEPIAETSLNFQPAHMRKLFELGRQMALSGKGWANEPPRLEQLERISRR